LLPVLHGGISAQLIACKDCTTADFVPSDPALARIIYYIIFLIINNDKFCFFLLELDIGTCSVSDVVNLGLTKVITMADSSFFENSNFMPHGMCYLWQPDILWTSVISDVLTALAYFSITIAVVIFVRKREDLPYPWFFILVGSIIFLACGSSHLVSAIVIWKPIYGISAIIKAITAFTSVMAGIIIWFVIPIFLKLPSPSMLEKKNQELQESLNKLKIAQLSLIESEKMASLGGLVAGIAHEINTPIGIAITASSHLSDTTKTLSNQFKLNKVTRENFDHYIEDTTSCAEILNTNLRRSAELVNSFKLVAVDQSNKNLRLYNVKEYTEKILASLKPALKKIDCQITLHCSSKISLWGDPSDLTQIITNLVMNSLTHGFEHVTSGNIGLNFSISDQYLNFTYNDSGSGISAENIEKIFDPFFTTKRGKGSSGLGMNIVYNVVTQSLNGTITCTNRPEGGIEFSLKLPLTELPP